jgi:hypothetical protein
MVQDHVGPGRADRIKDHPHTCATDTGRRARAHLMTTTIVQYQTKPDRAQDNTQLIAAVFAELDERQPEGFTYKVFKLDDGVSFIHVFIEHDDVVPDSLQELLTFKAFMAGIAERSDSPPVTTAATIVGGFR